MRKTQLDTLKCIFSFKNQTMASITKTLISRIDSSGRGWSLYLGPKAVGLIAQDGAGLYLGPKALGLYTNQDMALLNLNSATYQKSLRDIQWLKGTLRDRWGLSFLLSLIN